MTKDPVSFCVWVWSHPLILYSYIIVFIALSNILLNLIMRQNYVIFNEIKII